MMKYVLLSNTGIAAESRVIERAVEISVYRPLHPHVYRKSIEIVKAKQGCAGGNLETYSEYLGKLADGYVV